MLIDIDTIKTEATSRLDQSRRGELGQFLTPSSVAKFMASLFDPPQGRVRLLEAGAGVGTLIASFLEVVKPSDVTVTAYEIDPLLVTYLSSNLGQYTDEIRKSGGRIETQVLAEDFIIDASLKVAKGERFYSHAILNPPYKKMHSQSIHKKRLSALGLEHVNLYTAFVSLALAQLEPEGQLVAIIPRSFCNGPYYKPFRKFILGRASIVRIHLFESRTQAFKDDEVLQENIIIHLVRGGKQGSVVVSKSSDQGLADLQSREFLFEKIVKPSDPESMIYVPQLDRAATLGDSVHIESTLQDIDIQVSTGPIVDFRVKDYLRKDSEEGSVPLLYPVHFNGTEVDWPVVSKKPNAIMIAPETRSMLWPTGFYTLVRRFSSKEERQRIVARVVNPESLPSALIGLENHLNVFHNQKCGLEADIAYGLAAYLNSSIVDRYFRSFNGHTQVNATDLKRLRYPSRQALIEIGVEVRTFPILSPETVDPIINRYL